MSDHNDVISPADLRSAAFARVLARGVRPVVDTWSPVGWQLWATRWIADGVGVLRNPRKARVRRVCRPDVRGWWVETQAEVGPGNVILYLHGGGFFFGSPRSHYGLAKRLSASASARVFLVDYRRAPEHPFPAAPDDALAAYCMLLADGIDPAQLAVVGDSAGGHLVGSLLHDLRRSALPNPAAVVLFSPLTDITGARALARDEHTPDPFLPMSFGAKGLAAYRGGTPATDPRLAVLEADKRGWPPVLIQVGGTEVLLDDARALADSLRAADQPCELQVWPGQVHVFQGFARLLPQARAALAYAGDFLRAHLESELPNADRRANRPA